MKHRFVLKAALVGILLQLTANFGNADVILNGLNYSENFDTLPTANVGNWASSTVGVQSLVPGIGWSGTKISGSGATATALTASNGSVNSGAVYSYGTGTNSDRALGMLASGTNVMAIGARFVNQTGLTITEISVAFTQENWRSSTTAQNVMAAGFSTGDSSVTASNFLSVASGFSAANALNLVGPAPVTTNGALNGNDAANQIARSFTFSGLNVADGESFFLRWQDINEAGNDAGLGIDNFSMSFSAVPEPATMLLLGVAGIGGFAFRRFRRKSVSETVAS